MGGRRRKRRILYGYSSVTYQGVFLRGRRLICEKCHGPIHRRIFRVKSLGSLKSILFHDVVLFHTKTQSLYKLLEAKHGFGLA